MLITYSRKDNPQILTDKYDNQYFKGIQVRSIFKDVHPSASKLPFVNLKWTNSIFPISLK